MSTRVIACTLIVAIQVALVSSNAQTPVAALCSQGNTICVDASAAHSLISNPLVLTVRVASSEWDRLTWKLTDATGKALGGASNLEYWESWAESTGNGDASKPATVHVRNFIFPPAASNEGTFVLTAERNDVEISRLTIPVRLSTATGVVTIVEPESDEKLLEAVDAEWSRNPGSRLLNLPVKLTARSLTMMAFRRADLVEATAEAVLHSHPGQAAWHVKRWRQVGGTVHITLAGETWAGASVFMGGVGYLIRKSLLKLPGITNVVFE